MKKIQRVFAILCVVLMLMTTFTMKVSAGNRTTIYNNGIWRVDYESADGAKNYPHLHFYKNRRHFYCLRLDNLQPCDSTGHNKGKVPKHVMKDVMNHYKVKPYINSRFPATNSGWVKAIVKPLLII